MIEKMLPEELNTNPLKISDIASYLHQNGWQEITHPNPRLIVFQGAADDEGNPIQLVLPSQKTFEDSNRLITKAINLLAAIEEKSPDEIIDLVTQTHAASRKNT
ncbi:hypothetical protein NIES267_39570 [Calothrix parasitica NIES-267]|uniref:Uncharacterized protein n=1 Tax=Calothrix parasitica NIES-267 TaxID=1973488 RepID=A0A1Z4LTI0_9CYAN|nr:hypothetical protein NIES267_39570 [Calothrix parasitica NIES-267]